MSVPPRPCLTKPTISVLCPTIHPGPLVAAILQPLRGVVDEIIIAADSRASESDLAAYAAAADRLIRFEHLGFDEQWPWLTEQAGGDWILILDGDELVSDALIAALPALTADRRVAQHSLPIHWPWQSAERRLADDPWATDRRLRLLRNDGRLQFSGLLHELAEPAPPIAYHDDLPVYHLNLLMLDRRARAAKVAEYDATRFGLWSAAGQPFNHAWLLPEALPHEPQTAAIPALEVERIQRAMAAYRQAQRPRRRRRLTPLAARLRRPRTRLLDTLPVTDRATILASAPGAVLREPSQRGELTIKTLPTFTAQRADNVAWVELTHHGTVRWPSLLASGPKIQIGACWQPLGGGARTEAARTPLPHALDPGETILVPLVIPSPQRPGDTELVLDLVDERRWFHEEVSAPVTVLPSATQRLDALTEQHGARLPLAALVAARRAIGRQDGLARGADASHAAAPPPPSEPRLAELVATLAPDLGALDGPTTDQLAALVRRARPQTLLELGSGTSTIVLATLLAEQDPEARLITLEQDQSRGGYVQQRLEQLGLGERVTLIHAPLGATGPGLPRCYALTDAAAACLRAHPPEAVVVGGPARDSDGSSLAIVDLLTPFLRGDTPLVLRDAFRDAALSVATAWTEHPAVTVHGYRTTPDGLLEATLHPTAALAGAATTAATA